MGYQSGVRLTVFACNANPELAKRIAGELGTGLGDSEVTRFSDGEINMRINQAVRGQDVFIIQPTCEPVNENLMELLIMIDALRRASADRITAIIPYFGYARQDRKARARDPISAKLVANLITAAGASRMLAVDLHCEQLQGFFDIPVDNLSCLKMFINYYKDKFGSFDDIVTASPDLGGVARTRRFAEGLDTPMAIVEKRRTKPNVSEVMNVIGDVKDKRVIMMDDIIDTAGSITGAAAALKKHGAREVYACATHAVLSGRAVQRIGASALDEVLVTDTIPLPDAKRAPKIKTISVAPLLASAASLIHEGLSISKLFD